MLDVHPPHESAHSWTDFFIHIATIVVGLLIAIGLEQSVEWVHHRSEVRETRKLLKEALTKNVKRYHEEVSNVRLIEAELYNDIRIFQFLQQHPGTPTAQLPGLVFLGGPRVSFDESAWLSAKQSNVLALMPEPEVEDSRQIYAFADRIDARSLAVWECLNQAAAFRLIQSDESKLSRAQVDAEIPLIQNCLQLEGLEVLELMNMQDRFPDFWPGPTYSEYPAKASLQDGLAKQFPQAWAFWRKDGEKAEARDNADQPGIELVQSLLEEGPAQLSAAYKKIHAQYPSFKPESETILRFGYDELKKGHTREAISIFQFCGELYPDYWNVYDSLGDAYLAANKKKLAVASYQHSLRLNPGAKSSIDALTRLQH